MRKKGFSLIELLVVIAIIGLLSVLAVPYYKKYIIRGEVGALITTIEGLIQQALQYSNDNGRFPNASEFLNNTVANTTVNADFSQPGAINSALIRLKMQDISTKITTGTVAAAACGRAGIIAGTALFGSSGSANAYVFQFSCLMAHANGVVKTQCYHSYDAKGHTAQISTTYGAGVLTAPSQGMLASEWPAATSSSSLHAEAQAFFSDSTCMF